MLQNFYSEPQISQKYSKDIALHQATLIHIKPANTEDTSLKKLQSAW